ncbi:MAG TPA: elongation factor P [Candidatus Wildermuthbacteria bacterium]|nr:elongation factor P [Candidatus Wildermuthbacteria bacterium]
MAVGRADEAKAGFLEKSMLSYYELRKGVQFIYEGQPYEVLEFRQMGKSQDVVVAQTKIRNLITGRVLPKNFHQGEVFEEADLIKFHAKFIYANRGKFVFAYTDNPGKRFELIEEQVGDAAKFLKLNQEVEGIIFQDKIINITLPVKVRLKVKESPPGVKGDRSQGGTKAATLETGAVVQVPLFVESGNTIEVNTETGEYTRRLEKGE